MKYRKLSPTVEAVQYRPGEKMPKGVVEHSSEAMRAKGCAWLELSASPFGNGVVIRPGDWIVTEADGTRRRVPADQFAEEYEPVMPGPPK